MGIHFPNLRDLHTDQKAPRSHAKVPRQAEDLRTKHTGWQIRVFGADEGQRLHGREWARGVQEFILEFRVDDIRGKDQDHLLAMQPSEVFRTDQAKDEIGGERDSFGIPGKDSH